MPTNLNVLQFLVVITDNKQQEKSLFAPHVNTEP